MSESKCQHCSKVLFSEDRVYKRFCCEALFHIDCICRDHLRVCPACQSPSNETLTWVPICIVNDSEDERPTKRRKVDTGECVICLEAGTGTDQVVTTECCNQTGHVSCLRTYYHLPAESCSRHDRKKVAENLGVPNCFVCRGQPDNIVGLTKGVLEAILPEVRKKPCALSVDYANKGLMAWKQLIARMVHDLPLPFNCDYSLDGGTLKVRYENGTVETKQISGLGDSGFTVKFRNRLSQRLTDVVHRWAGLTPMQKSFDMITYRYFTLRGIEELVLNLTISQHYRRVKRSTRPGALPFEVEYENTKIATWTCTGHYFDFEDMEFHEVEDEEPYSARLSFWHYDFDRAVMNASKRRDVKRKTATKKK